MLLSPRRNVLAFFSNKYLVRSLTAQKSATSAVVSGSRLSLPVSRCTSRLMATVSPEKIAVEKQDDNAFEALPTNDGDNELLQIRHSSAHVMAMAVQKLFPEAQVTIGPWIDNGFYYDFYLHDLNLLYDANKTFLLGIIKIISISCSPYVAIKPFFYTLIRPLSVT